jgi:hypothetical protein
MKRRTFIKTIIGGGLALAVRPLESLLGRFQCIDQSIVPISNAMQGGGFHHFAVVRDSMNMRYFIDGIEQNTCEHIPFQIEEKPPNAPDDNNVIFELKPINHDEKEQDFFISGGLDFDCGNEDFTVDFWANEQYLDEIRIRNGTSKFFRPPDEGIRVELERRVRMYPETFVVTNGPLED